MNATAHFEAAERLALSLRNLGEHTFHDEAPIILAEAQVHATLALAAQVREVGDQLALLPSSLHRLVRIAEVAS